MDQPSADPVLLLHEFHPPEDLRRFACTPASVILADEAVVVIEAVEDGRLLRHHMWADRWFTITTTTDLAGRFVEKGGGPRTIPFAFDCDISTPFTRIDNSVYTVDLWLDVLIRADGTTYQVVDRDHFARARENGWLSEAEVSGALRGLEDLVGVIERGNLIGMLSAIAPFGPAERPEPNLLSRADPSGYPLLLPGIRSSW